MLGAFATAAVSTVFASSLGLLAPALGGRWGQAAILVVAFGFWSLINMRGVTLACGLNRSHHGGQAVTAPVDRDCGRVFFVRGENLQVAEWPAAGDFARMSLLLAFAFAGIEVALIPSGEVPAPPNGPCRAPSRWR